VDEVEKIGNFDLQAGTEDNNSDQAKASGMMVDFFTASDGNIRRKRWQYRPLLRLLDAATDARAALATYRARKVARRMQPQTVLLTAVKVPGREADLARAIAKIIGKTRHNVDIATAVMEPVGKFDNINHAMISHDLINYDWLLVIDDDIDLPNDFLDLFIYFCHTHSLKLAQPAHRFDSYASFKITRRHWASQARRTGYVEIGPVCLLHRDTFADFIPFPSLRWAWGLDIFWAHVAKRKGWRMGVIDAVPIGHLRPVGGSYDMSAARDEAMEFLASRGVTLGKAEMFGVNQRIA
jgi:hypothetical protein